jgi:hypothetical protein
MLLFLYVILKEGKNICHCPPLRIHLQYLPGHLMGPRSLELSIYNNNGIISKLS